jgi:outer membrane protein OmpA-like peptidoglycan-associated protein
LFAATPAAAQQVGALDTDLFRPQMSGLGLFGAESANVLPHLGVGFGLTFGYGHRPLVLTVDRAFGGTMVSGRLTGTATAALGLAGFLELGAAVPYALFNDQRATDPRSFSSVSGLGTTRFQLKARLLTEARHGLGLAFVAGVGVPTGSTRAYLGEDGVTFSPALAFERAFGPVRLLLNAGYTRRSAFEQFGQRIGDDLFYNFGVGVRVHDRLELGAELWGATSGDAPFTGNRLRNPTELLVGGRVRFADNWVVAASGGPGLSSALGTPTFRTVASLAYAPPADTDGDGVPDKVDQCPAEAGAKENYGCAGPSRVGDRDLDGVSDDVDECPNVAGPAENYGCPWKDRDGDGVPDNADLCPGTPGWRHLGGCLGEYEVPGIPLFNADGAASLPPWRFLYNLGFQFSLNPNVLKVLDTDIGAAARARRFEVPRLDLRMLAMLTIGLGLPSGYQLSVTVPIQLYPDPLKGWQREVSSITNLTTPSFGIKIPLLSQLTKGLGISLIPNIGLPTGSPVRGFPGQSGFTFSPTFAFEKHLTRIRRVAKSATAAARRLACGHTEQLRDVAADTLAALRDAGKEFADRAREAASAARDQAKAMIAKAGDAVAAAKKEAKEWLDRARTEAEKAAAQLKVKALIERAATLYERAKAEGKAVFEQLRAKGRALFDQVKGKVDSIREKARQLVEAARKSGRALVDDAVNAAKAARERTRSLIEGARAKGRALLEEAGSVFKAARQKGEALLERAKNLGAEALEQARARAKALVERARDAMKQAQARGRELWERAKAKGQELVQRAKEAIDAAREKLREALARAEAKGREMVRRLRDKAEEMIGRARDAVDKAQQRGRELLEQAKARGQQAIDEVRRKAEELIERAKDAMAEAKRKGQELVERAKGAVDAAKAKARTMIADVRRSAEEAVAQAKAKAKALFEEGKRMVEEAIDRVRQKGEAMATQAVERLTALRDRAAMLIEDPMAALRILRDKALGTLQRRVGLKVTKEASGATVFSLGSGPRSGLSDEWGAKADGTVACDGGKTIPIRFIANVGYTVRNDERIGDLRVDDEITMRLGFGFLLRDRLELMTEASFATAADRPFGRDERRNPIEIYLGGRFAISKTWHLLFGAGAGLTRSYGERPVRGFLGVALFPEAPADKDSDGDGVPDGRDRCPREAGPADNRGCPWPDRDGDGVLDKDDGCPLDAGPRENQGCAWPDGDGDGVFDKDDKCPDRSGPLENQGCPWPDRDGDGVPDKDDKCPDASGPKQNNGCPPDRDGDGVPDDNDACPDRAGPLENKGCPWGDGDGDGVLDKDDRCPKVAGPKENGGCPWPDSDGDGVPDKDDRCPKEPGLKNNQGCPEELKLSHQFFFASGSAKILRASEPALDELAALLKKHKRIKRFEIQGHTDDVGSERFNKRLSQRRAQAIHDALIERGIEDERIEAKGYGSSMPAVTIDEDNMTKEQIAEARRQNRRVRFVVLERQ